MSFVSVVATENFVTVMSDGRVKGIKNGEILQEDYQKFISANQGNAFVAYAGTKELCEVIALDIVRLIEEGQPFELIHKIFLKQAVASTIPEKYTVMFAFGGISENNRIEVYSYNSRDNAERHYVPVNDQINYLFLNNSAASDTEFYELFVNLLRETGFESPSSTIQAQKLLNRFVAERDDSVNNKTFRLTIKK